MKYHYNYQTNASVQEWAKEHMDRVIDKFSRVRERSKDKIPYLTRNGVHDDRSDLSRDWNLDDGLNWWTNGFFAGILWMLYESTGDQAYAAIAEKTEQKLDACFDSFLGLHHDTGFMWRPAAGADFDLTGNPESKKRALHAANLLAGRFNPNGFIRAWNDIPGSEDDTRGWAIIDCMINLSLLYWASEETGDPRFRLIASRHADSVQKYYVREDGSVCHIVEFDPESGAFIRSLGGQGYKEGSSWTRGQGWGVYGFMISYLHTGKQEYLETAKKIGNYILSCLPESGIIPVDFCQPQEPAWEDSCGACVIANGLLELARVLGEEGKPFLDAAVKILQALDRDRLDWSDACDSLVLNCSASYHNKEHHITMTYADFYYIEALRKLCGGDLYFIW